MPAPRWLYPAGVVQVTLRVDGVDVRGAGSLSFQFDQMVVSAEPDSGLVFGAYLVLHGFGFREERDRYVCQLRVESGAASLAAEGLEGSTLVLNGTVLTPPTLLSTTLECRLPAWPHPEMATEVFLLFDGQEVAMRGARPSFAMISAWTTAEMLPSYSFMGGGSVLIIGGGFSTTNKKYTCGWTSGGSCGHSSGTGCLSASSSDTTLPPALRGPYAAESWGTLRCYLPAWLHANGEVLLSVYADTVPVERVSVVPALPLTSMVSSPGIHAPSSSTNGNWRGGTQLTIAGQAFGLVDLSQRARLGSTACPATGWVSATSLRCLLPLGENSATFGAAVHLSLPLHLLLLYYSQA